MYTLVFKVSHELFRKWPRRLADITSRIDCELFNSYSEISYVVMVVGEIENGDDWNTELSDFEGSIAIQDKARDIIKGMLK